MHSPYAKIPHNVYKIATHMHLGCNHRETWNIFRICIHFGGFSLYFLYLRSLFKSSKCTKIVQFI